MISYVWIKTTYQSIWSALSWRERQWIKSFSIWSLLSALNSMECYLAPYHASYDDPRGSLIDPAAREFGIRGCNYNSLWLHFLWQQFLIGQSFTVFMVEFIVFLYKTSHHTELHSMWLVRNWHIILDGLKSS